ncbi:hypothetical protein P175DRAFT_0499367 [Aspergillus ochraceoroseus IBT 24754]|uniref:ADP-ribose 1''-phosphate phosphatase n=2 Tax=Aspergillus ochraceoroseus TaxID=138278 RepID=A0A2T5M2Q6_9EURO|nr:uncharacterized protein P175DRAFT_0499367 [Aspergillus ochraceoroseus IBT 24754]KKK18341.1 hypothetical protein AOCH_002528 [Aspergillus ochraceoroseus]PTU22830.1 hypothetical protein P175DRAFT_0499367 [Aspergillus ochraceoroseus IBT 24754]
METSTQNKIREIEGDLFDAPNGAALIHACNCQGSWGKGIALAFRNKYPTAFAIYRSFCQNHARNIQDQDVSPRTGRKIQLPEGRALIIPPQAQDYDEQGSKKHWIVCLFTSRGYGRNVSSAEVILENTELAVADMKKQLQELSESPAGEYDIAVDGLWSCRFNAGLFGVDWSLSRQVLEDSGLEVTVVRPPGEK